MGLARDGPLAISSSLQVRDGVLIGRVTHTLADSEGASDRELLARSVAHAYLSGGSSVVERLPREILLPADFPDREVLQQVLTDRAGRRVRLQAPKRGAKVRLIELAVANARQVLDERVRKGGALQPRTDDALYELQDSLRLKVVPRLIACFDVSHTQGADTVAAAVAFLNGEPRKAGYRHMRIRGDWGNDDYRSMAEAVTRYFALDPAPNDHPPDLVVVDGGKGQLTAAKQALEASGLGDLALAALAKKDEIVFLPGLRRGVRIPRTARSLHLLQRVRDEAHRFAVRYTRKLRSRRTVRSDLGDIPGIGPKRQQALLSRFGSLRGVRQASATEIGRIPGFSEGMGVKILHYLGRGSA